MSSFRNEIASWPSPASDARVDFEWFQSVFDTNDFMVISWPELASGDDSLDEIISDLESCQMIEDVWSGWTIYRLLREDVKLDHETAMNRLIGSVIGRDGKLTGLFLTLTREAGQNRVAAIESIESTLRRNDIDPVQTKMAGPAFDMYSIDKEGFWSPVRSIALIALLAFLLTWWFVREFKLAVFINGLGLYTGQLTLALVYLSGHHLNALVWTLPTLILLLTVSATLHFRAYYREARLNGSVEAAADLALKAAWRPIVYCAITTAAGLFSLMLSETRPVVEFGMFGGIAVLASATLVLLCMPQWLSVFPHTIHAESKDLDGDRIWKLLASFTHRARFVIIPVSILLLVCGGMLIPGIRTSVNIRNFFPADHKVVKDLNWIETRLMPLSTVELILEFQHPQHENDVNRLRWIEALGKRIVKVEGVAAITTPATFAPVWPKGRHGQRGVKHSLDKHNVETLVEELRKKLPDAKLLKIDDQSGAELWRISAHIEHENGRDLMAVANQISTIADDFFNETKQQLFPEEILTVSKTGLALLFNHVEGQFLRDLLLTYSTAFGLISILVLIILRSFQGLVFCSLPNLFPALFVLGGAVGLNISMDVATLMVASVALGIAVDDTLHFVLWWREKVRAGMPARDAVVDAMQHCGMAMVQTSVICGVSVTLYAVAGFLPTVRFGLMLSAMLFAALLGDLILLPALLSTKSAEKIAGKPA